MRNLIGGLILGLSGAVTALACSGDGNPNEVAKTNEGCADGGYSCGDVGACEGTHRAVNDAYCRAADCSVVQPDCARAASRPVESCCVLVGEPGNDPNSPTLVRTTDTKDYSDPAGGPPNLTCFDPAHYPAKPPGGPQPTVTMQGYVEAFSNGCDLVGVKIEVYTVKRTGDPATDGEVDQLIGTAVTTSDQSEIVLESVDKCVDDRKNRKYVYPNVPINTELVVKTSSVDAAAGWSPLYTYNIYIYDGDPDYDATAQTFTRKLQALATDDFSLIPSVAIGQGITPGKGAIGGEVHDCDNYILQNARVDISTQRQKLVYFNQDEDNPLPDQARDNVGTGRTGLYSALNVAPGWVRIAATGLESVDGTPRLVSLGYFDARVYADSVTSLTLRGLRPFQVP